jgi:hypothetical protein
MSGWLKKLLFGIWVLLLIPLIAPVLKHWLEQNVFSDAHGTGTTAFRDVTGTIVFSNLVALGEQHWFKLAVMFLTGLVVGVSLEWLNRKSGEKKAAELRSLGWKFRSLSESIRLRPTSSQWPDSVHDLKPAMLSMFASARNFDLWAPGERAFQLPDATFLCEYFRCVGKHLEDGDFDEARQEAQSWKPFLDQAPRA